MNRPALPPITASMLYDLVACPHRVTMDVFADPAERDPVSPFVQLLWDHGAAYERDVVAGIGEPAVAHDALADARTCAQCFFELKRRGVLA